MAHAAGAANRARIVFAAGPAQQRRRSLARSAKRLLPLTFLASSAAPQALVRARDLYRGAAASYAALAGSAKVGPRRRRQPACALPHLRRQRSTRPATLGPIRASVIHRVRSHPVKTCGNSEFGFHLLDGKESHGSCQCHQGAGNSGTQGLGRMWTTFHRADGGHWNLGVHSAWKGAMNQPGALLIR